MRLYEDAFGLTRLRLLVEVFALWLGAVLVLVGAAGAVAGVRARLAPAAVLLTAGGVLAFSFGNPDRYIAERNIDRWEATGSIDESYLAGLSADAVPALVEMPAARRQRVTVRLREQLRTGDPWSSANQSRSRARTLLGLPGR
jgi:predicted RNA-binding Zn ribbon-like protein